jgi:hypothetical protein
VPSKDELVERMVDMAFGDHPFTSPPPDDWIAAVEMAAHHLWAIFGRHRWVAAVMSFTRPQITPNVLAYAEWVMSALHAAGLQPLRIFQVHLTLFTHVRGLAVSFEPEAIAEQETGMAHGEFLDTRDAAVAALTSSGAYPTFQAVAAAAQFDLDLDEQFEFGLGHLLAGLAGLPLGDR